MSNIILIGQGWVLGFLIAAPIGPVGAMCFERSLRVGFWAGITSGIGAALADGFYAAVAGLGVVSILNFLKTYERVIALSGCILLVVLGMTGVLRSRPARAMALQVSNGRIYPATYALQTFAVTITNPATILSFVAALSSVSILQNNYDLTGAGLLVTGVVLGSLCWWFILCGSAMLLRHRLSDQTVVYINKATAIGLIIFGLLLIIKYWFS